MIYDVVGDAVSFHSAPPAGQNLHLTAIKVHDRILVSLSLWGEILRALLRQQLAEGI